MSDIRAVSYAGGYTTTPSDSTNDPSGPFAAFEATDSAGIVKVTCVDGSVVSVYCLRGVPKTLEVLRIWSTGTSPSTVIGYKAPNGIL